MSLTDPAVRNRRLSSIIRPVAWVLAILSLALSPILLTIAYAIGNPSQPQIVSALIFVIACVGFGLLLYYTAAHRNGLGITSYSFAYAGGFVLLLESRRDDSTGLPESLPIAAVLYLVALILFIIYIVHSLAAHQTLQDGVETTATVTEAGVNGMVNYVTHWRLTLKFTDQQGKERWFHIGRTGYGYSVGQQFTIKYNPKNPGSRLGIVVVNE
jgi:peptidoglycan biosynthesis protein MviN/MurJ (putative lipid II flippase)